jgi:hypothetical protein
VRGVSARSGSRTHRRSDALRIDRGLAKERGAERTKERQLRRALRAGAGVRLHSLPHRCLEPVIDQIGQQVSQLATRALTHRSSP